MIHGHKPSGYAQVGTAEGSFLERETRQCCHCQHTWLYTPGSGDRRGYCFKHAAFLCGRDECMKEQLRMTDHYESVEHTRPSCLAFEEYNDWLGNRMLAAGGDWTIGAGGILVPREIIE